MPSRSTRKYDGTTRRAKAEETRARVLASARSLFAQRGLDQVTIEAIAAHARVSVATVYGLFKSKAGLLKAMMERSLFNARFQTLAEGLAEVDDPVQLLQLTAAIARAIYDGERAGLGLVRGASAFSSELRDIEQQFERIRYDMQFERAQRIAKRGTARAGLTLPRVRDVLWMFTGHDVYRMLVVERRWSSDAYERWLADTLVRTLLDEADISKRWSRRATALHHPPPPQRRHRGETQQPRKQRRPNGALDR
jgi:AcrR family transcriptional regulator